jgi:hypothetical protein
MTANQGLSVALARRNLRFRFVSHNQKFDFLFILWSKRRIGGGKE